MWSQACVTPFPEISSQTSEDQPIFQEDKKEEQQTQNQDLTKPEEIKRDQEVELQKYDVMTERHDQQFFLYEENIEGQVTKDQVSQRTRIQKFETTDETMQATIPQQSLTEKEPASSKEVQSTFYEGLSKWIDHFRSD